jgi:hypothetical protein
MNFEPTSPPQGTNVTAIVEFLWREFRRVGIALKDDAETVQYITTPANQGSLTAGVSANYKIAAGNVIRVSSSATVTLTGIALKTPNRSMFIVNVGTGVVVLKSQGTESSASHRFALSSDLNLSANASALIWYDAASSRWRGLAKT